MPFVLKMAASMECCVHLLEGDISLISSLSVANYTKICDCILEWISLDGKEQDLAHNLDLITSNCPDHPKLFSGNVTDCVLYYMYCVY